MLYELKEENNTVVILLKEEYFEAILAEDLKKLLDEQVEKGSMRIELDLSQVRIITSHWIGMLLLFRKHFQEKGGQLKLTNINETIRGVFQLMNVDTLLGAE